MIPLMGGTCNSLVTETESRMVVPGPREGGGVGSYCLVGGEFRFRQMEESGGGRWWRLHRSVSVPQHSCTLQMGKMGDLGLCAFYHCSKRRALAGWLSWLERCPGHRKGTGLISRQGSGHKPRLQVRCPLGARTGDSGSMCLSHISASLSLSLLVSLQSINTSSGEDLKAIRGEKKMRQYVPSPGG